ncbi:MAG TPA: TIGR04283 family arsenosugar biosynthesis glycosyltransferase [Syntrophales bacterium]
MTPQDTPSVSVIIPVLHEAHQLDSLLDHLYLMADNLPVEVIVVDGSPDGETLRAISREGVTLLTAPAGRALQMNAGAAAASGDFLLFLHADTRLPRGAFRRIAEALSDGRYVAGAFDLRYGSRRPSIRLIAGMACIRSRLTRIPYGDQAQFFRRDCFEILGGFSDIPLMEDVEIMLRIKEQGDRIFILPEPVVTSARRQEKEGIVRCTLRNWSIVTLYCMGMSPERLVRFYKNH